MQYTVEQLAYFAGLFDGEGCLHIGDKRISPKKSKGIRKLVNKSYNARVNFSTAMSLSNTNFEVIEWLKSNFGGFITTQKKPGKPHWNLRKTWVMSPCSNISNLLNFLLPFLIIKKKQALLMIEARAIIDSNTRRMQHSDQDYNRLLELSSLIKNLNTRKILPPYFP